MIKFENSKNIINLIYAKKMYSNIINVGNIFSFHKSKIKKIFQNEEVVIVDQYLRYLLNQYMSQNYKTKIYFLRNIKKLIKIFGIKLNDIDQNKIRILEERIFSLDRHIKVLKTNYKLIKGEFIVIKYVDTKIFNEENSLRIIHVGEMIISNKRIIFTNQKKLIFWWKEISCVNFNDYGMSFKYKNKKKVINIHDAETLANNICNIKKIIKSNKKILLKN